MSGEALEDAHRQYVISCARCHQVDGEGYEGLYPALAGSPLVTLHDPSPVVDIVMNGHGSMPAFRYALEAEEIARLISYIRGAWSNEANEIHPGQVR